jgi:hypothetical protein
VLIGRPGRWGNLFLSPAGREFVSFAHIGFVRIEKNIKIVSDTMDIRKATESSLAHAHVTEKQRNKEENEKQRAAKE